MLVDGAIEFNVRELPTYASSRPLWRGATRLELDGERYTSELRIAAVDLTRRGHAKVEAG